MRSRPVGRERSPTLVIGRAVFVRLADAAGGARRAHSAPAAIRRRRASATAPMRMIGGMAELRRAECGLIVEGAARDASAVMKTSRRIAIAASQRQQCGVRGDRGIEG